MNRREKLLAAGVGLIAALFGLNSAYESLFERPLEAARQRSEQLHEDILRRQQELRHVRDDRRQLARWQEQSLPTNLELARSAYQSWLLELVEAAGWDGVQVDPAEPNSRRGLYQTLSFSVRGRGSPAQIVQFLYEFYRADHLHQIRSLGLTPHGKQDLLDASLTIEALALPDATRDDRLSQGQSDRLALAAAADYDFIARRNIFAPGGQRLDLADHVFLTAVTQDGDSREAWFTLRGTDEMRRVRDGDELVLGRHRASVLRIDSADVLLALDGQLWLLAIGESLAQATAVPAEIGPLLQR